MVQTIIAGNWKMNKTLQESAEFIKIFKSKYNPTVSRKILFFPSYLSLPLFAQEFQNSDISYGAQNCHFETSGAFTGEVSCAMLQSVGATYCLVGHSERRTLFLETDQTAAKKIRILQNSNITPLLCIGETALERSEGQTLQVLEKQLEQGLASFQKGRPLIVAYEPVWAIGTGKVATPDDVKNAHQFIRQWTEQKFSSYIPILYGGSVSGKNSKDLRAIPHVNGFLIGGASLTVDSLMEIILNEN